MQTQGDLLVLRVSVSDARFGELSNAKFTGNPLAFSWSIIVKEVYAYSCFAPRLVEVTATEPYRELVAQHPEDVKMKLNLAFANLFFTKFGRTPGNALRQADEILQLDPTCQAAQHIRAMSIDHYYSMDIYHNFSMVLPYGDLVDILQEYETAIAMGPSNPHLELDRLKILAKIVERQPHLRETFAAEVRSRFASASSQFDQNMLNWSCFRLVADEPWFVAAKGQFRATPTPRRESFIMEPPSEQAIQQYLERTWE